MDNLKDILLHSRDNKNVFIETVVTPSRYAKILSDYWARYAINVDGLDILYRQYDYYILSDLDANGNSYKIIKDRKIKEEKGKCINCDCEFKRFINPETNVCYYKEAVNKNYLVKI